MVEDLPVGVQQRVEIVKALYRDANLLILDEPTAVLTPQETDELFEVLRSLHGDGHLDHLHHPQAQRGPGVADRITVLRRGRVVGTHDPGRGDAGAWPR